MRKKCPVCRKFTFELFKEEIDNKGNILLTGDGSCSNCGFKYEKRNLDNKTLDEQAIDYERIVVKLKE